jgi:hypothetical protein
MSTVAAVAHTGLAAQSMNFFVIDWNLTSASALSTHERVTEQKRTLQS